MVFRFRALLVSAAMFAAIAQSAAANAQEAPAPYVPDAATVAALAEWRAGALAHVTPASLHDAVAAMYADQPVSNLNALNEAAAAKAQAEQAALADMDRSAQLLIEHYFSQVQAQNSALAYDSSSD